MDYDFEAPTYVNFAEAMDDDESDASRYFDVEHEESFSRLKSTPGVILPGGPRAVSAKKPSVPAATSTPPDRTNPTQKSLRLSGQGIATQSPGKKSKTPTSRRSSGRKRTSTLKTPIQLKTPGSVKRLGNNKKATTTPGKVAAALTALKLTPIHKVVKTPRSSKRSQKENVDKSDQPSPSKRVKLSPEVDTNRVTNLEVSPPAIKMDGLLQQAIKSLQGSSRKGKRGFGGQLTAVVDGIEVPCVPEKEHAMETRADKAVKDPPIQLRSRSIVKVLKTDNDAKTTAVSRLRSQSCDRVLQPTQKSSREKSADRLMHHSRAVKASEPFVSLAEATVKFQNKTPLRFRVKRHNSPAFKSKGPVLALRATIPQSPALRVKHRTRPCTALSREEQEAVELEEIRKNRFKPIPIREKILKAGSIPKIEKKPPTLPEPFNITEIKKKEVIAEPEPVKFIARPVPKKILEGPVGISEKKQAPLTEPKSPSFRANALKRVKEATQRATPVKYINRVMKVLEESGGVQIVKDKPVCHMGVPFTAQHAKTTTEVKPFSFEERDKERQQRKEEKLIELQKQLMPKPTFHANPRRSFKTPPRIQRVASPATRGQTPGSSRGNLINQKAPEKAPVPKPALIPQFKARMPTVLHRKPFEPVKPNRHLPLPDVTLASEVRAKDREEFDRQLILREQEMEAARQLLKAEKERKEKEEIALLRKQVVHKPNPVPKVKPFEPQPSNKPLTDPNTPFCLKRSRKMTPA